VDGRTEGQRDAQRLADAEASRHGHAADRGGQAAGGAREAQARPAEGARARARAACAESS
jgi:hypothetical protein